MSFRSIIQEMRDEIGNISRRKGIEAKIGYGLRSRSHRAVAANVLPPPPSVDALGQSCWASMPPELLRDVLVRIEESEGAWPPRRDVAACAGVCRSWRDIMKEIVRPPEFSGKLTFPISLKQYFSSSTAFANMSVIEISYIRLLEEVSEKLHIQPPISEVTVTSDGWFLAYIDLNIVHLQPMIETFRCWGVPSRNILETKEDSARVAVKKMMEQFALQIKDANYEECILYKQSYDNLAIQYSDLLDRFNMLEQEHNGLKDGYNMLLTEKSQLMCEHARMRHEKGKMRGEINEYRMIIDSLRAKRLSTPTIPSDAGSAS